MQKKNFLLAIYTGSLMQPSPCVSAHKSEPFYFVSRKAMKNSRINSDNANRSSGHAQTISVTLAILTPLLYLWLYTPYGMDTTDFGYFYAYSWRILNGQIPYRDFFYIKPAFPLYWHAFWLNLTPESLKILMGKIGFLVEMLTIAWLGALYLNKIFNLRKLGLPISLLATSGFVFGIHTFPHMPWHTADGALFSILGIYCLCSALSIMAGLSIALAVLCKQSFLLLPVGAVILFLIAKDFSRMLKFVFSFSIVILCWLGWLGINGAWRDFLEMTTGQLSWQEAIDACILIYLRQDWVPPLLALLPWLASMLFHKTCPQIFLPCYCYIFLLGIFYIHMVFNSKAWVGFGLSWPTFFMMLGVVEICLPGCLLSPWLRNNYKHLPAASATLGMGLLAAWSCAISGGYKTPAFIAVIPLFCFYLVHAKMGGNVARLGYITLGAGLLMFACGFQYPYVFPQRELSRQQLVCDAGDIYPLAAHVYIDKDMYERLSELKALRAKYGSNYKTLPGFPMSNFLNGDPPAGKSDWYIDWEINAKIVEAYEDLLDHDYIVFLERDQADTQKADNYERAGYSVPQLVRKNWRLVEQTPHFLVYRKPAFTEEKH